MIMENAVTLAYPGGLEIGKSSAEMMEMRSPR
jgi:hypothetical protein